MASSLKRFLTLLPLACVFVARASAITLDYSNVVGASIHFDGASGFTFAPVANNFKITTAGAASGLLGEMTGSFSIGAVTTAFGISSASVSGTGTLVIHDGASNDLTGVLTWVDILQFGTGDFLNTSGTVNLTSITYAGGNAALLGLSSAGVGTNILSFQFTPAKSLAQLKTGVYDTSFSGTISTPVPEGGSTLLLAGLAILAVQFWQNRKQLRP